MKNHYIKFSTLLLLSIVTILLCQESSGQTLPNIPGLPQTRVKDTVKKDTVAKSVPRAHLKPYASVVTGDFETHRGLFTVHKNTQKEQFLFEIPDSILHRDLMVINRVTKTPGLSHVYPGEELSENTILFELGPDSTIRIRLDLLISSADSNSKIAKAVANSNINPIAASFPIMAIGKGHKSYVIDITAFLKAKNFINDLNPQGTPGGQFFSTLGGGIPREIYVDVIHTYPINVEIGFTKNFTSTSASGSPVTLGVNTSFIELPKTPMQRRLYDQRVGFFFDYYYGFSDDQQKSEVKQFVSRWRMEPKDADMEKWKKGELVEPKKPIVIYIDPATPVQWRPYLIQGINDWQKAFEQAGFKNAIMGREWPENDTTMHMDDARYSMLNYFPSDVENAYGPHVSDPRSGEIIQTHIGWYHNVMSLIHNWYMIQAGAVDPGARHAKFNDDLMGQLIQFVSSHEVGHTLGLCHNFGSSSQTPVDSLRNKHYLDVHGHTASIMDYARFNYVAQPEDHIPVHDLFPRIGEYDKWAIEWGYKYSGADDAEKGRPILAKLTTKRLAENPRLWFGGNEYRQTLPKDPRVQTEDLGDDAAKASKYGIRNLKRILPNLPAWNYDPDGTYENLTNAYTELKNQYFRYMGHVLKNIGNDYYNVKSETQSGNSESPVPKWKQQEALRFFDTELFTTPYWLLNPSVANKIFLPIIAQKGGPLDPEPKEKPNFIEDTQEKVLNSLMDILRLNLLLEQRKQYEGNTYNADLYVADLHKIIWKELDKPGNITIDTYRRNLQKAYLQNILTILGQRDEANAETDASSIIRADLLTLNKEIGRALPKVKDRMTLYHLQDVQSRINTFLKGK